MTDKPISLLQQAAAAFQAGALDDAERDARAVLDSAPGDAAAWDILAAALERKGDLAGALSVAQRAVEAAPGAVQLHNRLGLLLARNGRPADAEDQFRYALGLDPRQPDIAANLGMLLAQTGRWADAEFALRSAISLAPGETKYPLVLGRMYMAGGKAHDAKVAFAETVKLGRARFGKGGIGPLNDPAFNEPYFDALTLLAGANFDEGKPALALLLLQEAILCGGGEGIKLQFANCLCSSTFGEPLPALKPMLARAIREAWIMTAELVRAATPLLLLEPAFKNALVKTAAPGAAGLLSDADVRAVVADPLLLAILQDALVTDPKLERMLTVLRRALLQADGVPQAWLAFAVALANQNFTNEYAFAETLAERETAAALEAKIEQAARGNAAIADMDLALLAMYRPLSRLSFADALAAREWPKTIEPLIVRQLREPAAERAFAAAIPQLTGIDDATSQAVRQQYEENPYPRWIHTPVTSRRFTLDVWLRLHFPHLAPVAPPTAPLDILVAGCGTGQDPIGAAQRFVAANVLAVDLSLGSLAYAKRKTTELGLGNIEYAQADILGLGKLERRFDIIECAGVLHHLADPVAGWRVLTDLLRPGGFMVMALYSEQGRKDLRPVAEMVAANRYGTSADELRRFRAELMALPPGDKARAIVASRDDFYSLSMLRDLVFHVQEHRFTIGKIEHALRELGLEFCGFGLSPADRARFQQRFGAAADIASLELWDRFETENPGTFAAMYHLVVRKAA